MVELSPDISVSTFLSEALQLKNANTASVATILQMMEPGNTQDVVV